jgi:hypothetical protein
VVVVVDCSGDSLHATTAKSATSEGVKRRKTIDFTGGLWRFEENAKHGRKTEARER